MRVLHWSLEYGQLTKGQFLQQREFRSINFNRLIKREKEKEKEKEKRSIYFNSSSGG